LIHDKHVSCMIFVINYDYQWQMFINNNLFMDATYGRLPFTCSSSLLSESFSLCFTDQPSIWRGFVPYRDLFLMGKSLRQECCLLAWASVGYGSKIIIYIFGLFGCRFIRLTVRTGWLSRVRSKLCLHIKLHYPKILNFERV
jgi:hypothetical protein